MTSLVAAAIFWIVLHLGLAGSPMRPAVVARIGENGFRGVFSALSLIGIVWLAWAYRDASQPETFYGLWVAAPWMRWLPLVVMPFALLLFVGAVTVANPTAVGAEGALAREEPAVGMLRVTRHPMLWAFALWAAAHLVANGDLASLLLFGSVLVVALAGTLSIDRKRARQQPEAWRSFAAVTSIIPFLAILQGRNRLAWSEIGWWRPAAALVAWIALIALHPWAFGVPAVPG